MYLPTVYRPTDGLCLYTFVFILYLHRLKAFRWNTKKKSTDKGKIFAFFSYASE